MDENLKKWLEKEKGKKILFYNTCERELEEHGGIFIDKVKWVLNYFQKEEKICLIWKTFEVPKGVKKDIFPQIYADYASIIKKCEDSQNIVYVTYKDDCNYVKYTDAYYGKFSAYVFDFLLNNKPILIQNLATSQDVKEDKLRILRFENFIRDEKCIYFSLAERNGLFIGNLETGKANFLDFFKNEPYMQRSLHAASVRYENRIVFVPGLADHISIYDLKKGEMESVDLPKIEYQEGRRKFSNAFIYKNSIYFIPNRMPAILKLNMDNYAITSYTEWYEVIKERMMHPEDLLFFGDYTLVGDKCYLPFYQNSMVLEMDLSNEKMQFFELDHEGTAYTTICYDGEVFWLTSESNCVVSWAKTDGNVKKYLYPEGYGRGRAAAYKHSVYIEKERKVIFWPNSANMIIQVDTETGDVNELKVEGFKQQDGVNCFYLENMEKGIMVSRLCDGKIFYLNLLGQIKKEISFKYPMLKTMNFIEDLYLDTEEEGKDNLSLKYLFNYLKEKTDDIISSVSGDEVGSSIYNEILARLDSEVLSEV